MGVGRDMSLRDIAANDIEDYLNEQPEAYDIRTRKGTVDFTIGDPDLWPQYGKDGHIRVIRSSSISFDSLLSESQGVASQSNPQLGQNVHLPPAKAELWDELEPEADFSDKFALVNGTFELGSLLPPPDGVMTPHLLLVEDVDVKEVKDALDEVFRLYEEVYNSGDCVIKHQPNPAEGAPNPD